MNRNAEAGVLEAAIQQLLALGLHPTLQRKPAMAAGRRPDAMLRLGKGRTAVDYVVEAKRQVTPTTLGAALQQLQATTTAYRRPGLLVTDYVTPQVAEALRARRQPFADAAGNAYLEGPGLLVFVIGRKPTARDQRTHDGRAFTRTGLKVLFVMLNDPTLAEAPQRTIAGAANVALGAVPGVLADLQQQQHLLTMRKRRRLRATKRLLDEWAMAYARQLRPKTLLGLYTGLDLDTWRDWAIDPEHARWGGEPGAALLTGYLQPGVLTLYAERLDPRLVVAHRLVKARPADPQGTLEVRRRFWGELARSEVRTDTVPPALVYADLLATADARCLETAGMVYEQYLARLLPHG